MIYCAMNCISIEGISYKESGPGIIFLTSCEHTDHVNALQEEFEYTKGVIRIRISKKNRQHNGQKKSKSWVNYIISQIPFLK
jgi:hypothetical protein